MVQATDFAPHERLGRTLLPRTNSSVATASVTHFHRNSWLDRPAKLPTKTLMVTPLGPKHASSLCEVANALRQSATGAGPCSSVARFQGDTSHDPGRLQGHS